MPDGIDIEFTVSGVDKMVAALEASAAASDAAARAIDRQARSAQSAAVPFQKLTDLNKQMEDMARSGGSSVPVSRGGQKKKPYRSGLFQRQSELENELQSALDAGDFRGAADVRLEQKRNDAQIKKAAAPPPNFSSKLMDVLKTSRVSLGKDGLGDLMPLVGRVASLLGPEGTAIAAIATGAEKAAESLIDLSNNAAETAVSFSKLGFAGGGTGAQTALASGLGKSIGLSPEAIGGLAQAFNDKITTDPFAMSFAAQNGIVNNPGPFGNTDTTGLLLKFADALRSEKDPQERLRMARSTGTEALLPLTLLSDKQYGKIKSDAAVTQNVMSPGMQENSAAFTASETRLQTAMENIEAAIAPQVMDRLTDLFNDIADAGEKFAAWLTSPSGQWVGRGLRMLVDDIIGNFDLLHGNLQGYAANQKDSAETMLGQHDVAAPQDANVKALDANTRALQDFSMPGQYGHGDRYDRSLPQALDRNNGYALKESLRVGANRLGAFS